MKESILHPKLEFMHKALPCSTFPVVPGLHTFSSREETAPHIQGDRCVEENHPSPLVNREDWSIRNSMYIKLQIGSSWLGMMCANLGLRVNVVSFHRQAHHSIHRYKCDITQSHPPKSKPVDLPFAFRQMSTSPSLVLTKAAKSISTISGKVQP